MPAQVITEAGGLMRWLCYLKSKLMLLLTKYGI